MELTLHKEDIERLFAAKKIIETEFKSHYTTEQLAQKVGLNNRKLKCGFRQLFNTSLYQLLTQVRVEKAKDVLECKEYAVKCIATTVGFADVPTFIKAFKRNTGLCPNEWRRSVRRKLAS